MSNNIKNYAVQILPTVLDPMRYQFTEVTIYRLVGELSNYRSGWVEKETYIKTLIPAKRGNSKINAPADASAFFCTRDGNTRFITRSGHYSSKILFSRLMHNPSVEPLLNERGIGVLHIWENM